VRYDAAIIGAGADGLAAASLLARAGRKVVVVERAAHAGGRCVTSEFAPGFFASPYADAVTQPPAALLPLLGLPAGLLDDFAPVGADIVRRRDKLLARILAEAVAPAPRSLARRLAAMAVPRISRPWPAADWSDRSIADLRAHTAQGDWRSALIGRATDPDLAGSALTLLAAPQARVRQGGLGTIGAALQLRAVRGGAELHFAREAAEIILSDGRAAGVALGDGGKLAARAVISTLDFKRTFLGLFKWADLPPALLRDTGAWRMAGARARLLLALEAPPCFARPFFVPEGWQEGMSARAAFRHGVVPFLPPLLVDPVSLRDPTLAPAGKAVVTVTLGCIPARLFDGPWTAQKRELLMARTLERLAPLNLPRVIAAAAIVPPDIEEALGLTGGDLDGGALAPDQMLSFRPGPRTQVPGLYLAGPSSAAGPLGLGAAGIAAAVAVMADLSSRRDK
jgi:phytoene dehydrogenase-like protein